jgi:hypothetical protein
MDMPRPGDVHRKLHRFAGTWEGPEEMPGLPPGSGSTFSGRTTFQLAVDGLFVLGEYQQHRDGKPSFQGHTVFGVDATSGEVCWYWFDSMGFVPPGPSRGLWNGDTLVLTARFPQGEGRYTYELQGDDLYRFQLETSPDGAQFRTAMIGRYRKVGEAGKRA